MPETRDFWEERIVTATGTLVAEDPSLLDRDVDERCLSARLACLLASLVESPGLKRFVDAEFNKAIDEEGIDVGKDGPLGKRPDILVHNRVGAEQLGDATELWVEVKKWSNPPSAEDREIYRLRAVKHRYEHTCLLTFDRGHRRVTIQWLAETRQHWDARKVLLEY